MTDDVTGKKKLRSQGWFGGRDKMGFVHRAWLRNQGYPNDYFGGRPVIGICNTWSELTPCNGHLRELAENVKRGILEAGGVPMEFPVMSLGETIMKPTTMLFRNLASMDVEESLRANPLDGVVLMTGCDKTTPSLLMGACSVGLPALVVSGGPMLNGKFRGGEIGSGTFNWQVKAKIDSGEFNEADLTEAEVCGARSAGHCNTMGTASTMAVMSEALGMTLPGMASIPAADSRKKLMAQLSGRRIVDMVREDLTMDKVLTRQAFENAIVVNAAVGGSTNLILHLLAIAGRIGVPLALEDFDRHGSQVPLLVNLKPSGERLMEDFFYAGGLSVVMKELGDLLHRDLLTVNGRTLDENYRSAQCYDATVIRPLAEPLQPAAGIAVLRGNLCEQGAVIKPSAATPALLRHTGPAVVFSSMEDYHARIDEPDLAITADSVIVLQGVGPRGYPGMPEVGNVDLPRKLVEQGVQDMVRISDGRMSGTAYGTVVLHVAPEAAAGGTLALVQDGDLVALDVPARRLQLLVSDEELARRRAAWTPPAAVATRGYVKLYIDHVQQAHLGADLDLLVGSSGSVVERDSH
ncbi:IlvD/Edd family dehydratase [Roseateles sp. P5_E7]